MSEQATVPRAPYIHMESDQPHIPTADDLLGYYVPAMQSALHWATLQGFEAMRRREMVRSERVMWGGSYLALGIGALRFVQMQLEETASVEVVRPHVHLPDEQATEAQEAIEERNRVQGFMQGTDGMVPRRGLQELHPDVLNVVATLALQRTEGRRRRTGNTPAVSDSAQSYAPFVVARADREGMSVTVMPQAEYIPERSTKPLYGYGRSFSEARTGDHGMPGTPLYEEVAQFLTTLTPSAEETTAEITAVMEPEAVIEAASVPPVPEAVQNEVDSTAIETTEVMPMLSELDVAYTTGPHTLPIGIVESEEGPSGLVQLNKLEYATNDLWMAKGFWESFVAWAKGRTGRRRCREKRKGEGYDRFHSDFGDEKEGLDPFNVKGGTIGPDVMKRRLAEEIGEEPVDELTRGMEPEDELRTLLAVVVEEVAVRGKPVGAKNLKELSGKLYELLVGCVNARKTAYDRRVQAYAHRAIESIDFLRGRALTKRRARAKLIEQIFVGAKWDGRTPSAIEESTYGRIVLGYGRDRRGRRVVTLNVPESVDSRRPSDTDWQGFAADPEGYKRAVQTRPAR